MAVKAPSRSGKGVGIGVPNCLIHDGSLFAFSVKRDLWDAAAHERRKRGQKVFLFEPGNPERRTHRWNPLGNVPRSGVGVYDAAQKVMSRIIPESKSTNPFFDNAGRRWTTSMAVLLAETPGVKLNMATLKRTLSRKDRAKYVHGLVNKARADGRPYHWAAVNTTLGWLDLEQDKEVRSVLETIDTHLGLWDNEIVAAATEESDFDLSKIRSEPMSIFPVIGVSDMARYRPLLALFIAELIAQNTGYDFGKDPNIKHLFRPKCIFDEFWAAGAVPEMTDAVAFLASAGFDLCYITQTRQQIEHIQGKAGADNLFANTTEVFFAGADIKAAEEISRLGGNKTVEDVSHSKPSWMGWMKPDRKTESHKHEKRALILEQEVRTMDSKYLIISRRNMPLLKLERIIYFKNQDFAWMMGDPPVVPRLNVVTPRDEGTGPVRQEMPQALAGGQPMMVLGLSNAPVPVPAGAPG